MHLLVLLAFIFSSSYASILEIHSREDFREKLENSPKAIAIFTGHGCAPCKSAKEIIDAEAQNYPDVNFLVIDFDEVDELAQNYHVTSLPTIIQFSRGEVINGKHVGAFDASTINALVNKLP